MSKAYKKQHYVPASYLKKWTDPNCPPHHEPYVWVFDKDGSNPRKRAPSNIFTETDLYTIENTDGTRDLRLENSLSELESRFTRIRTSKFNFKRELSSEEKIYLCAFVAAAQFRTISSRDHHANQWGNVEKRADEMVDSILKATPKQREDAARIGRLSLRSDASLTNEQVKQLSKTPLQIMMPTVLNTVTPILMKMDMAVLCTNDPVGFITSDTPCIWYDPESYKRPPLYRSPGLNSATIEVSMPISPSQCLLFNWQKITGYHAVDSKILNNSNTMHRALCESSLITNTQIKNENWFYDCPMPDDAWDKLHLSK